MITSNIHYRHCSADTVYSSECLIEISICRTLDEITGKSHKLQLRMALDGTFQHPVYHAIDGVLHVSHIHEGE